MYEVSREDARSDLLLSGAVFVFGPLALQLLLGIVPVSPGPTGQLILYILLALLCTVVVPLLLMRYRNERPAAVLGVGSGDRTLAVGLLAAVPLLVAGAVQVAVGGNPIAQHPVLALAAGNPLAVAARLVGWMGVLVLALYVTVKARDAFGGMPSHIEEAAWRIGRVLALAAAVTAVLGIARALIDDAVPAAAALGAVAWPLAVAAMVWLILRRTAGVGTTSMSILLAPTVLCAVGSFLIPSALDHVIPMLNAVVLSAGVGLGVGILAERSRRGGGILLLGLLIALGTGLAAPLRL